MPGKRQKSSLADRIKKTDARSESRNAEVKYATGGGSLPAGVEGVAELTRVDFDEIGKGKYKGSQRFYCHGTCLEPETFTDDKGNVIKTKGKLVQPGMITLDDTKSDYGETSFAENLAKAEMRLKQLGFPTEDFDDELDEEVIAYFEKRQEDGEPMYFEFRTWSPEGSDRVLVQITGIPADYTPKEAEDDVDEGDDEENSYENFTNSKRTTVQNTIGKNKAGSQLKSTETDDNDESDTDELNDAAIDSLVELADGKDDGEAQGQLEQLALSIGKEQEEIDEAENWEAVGEWLKESLSDRDEDDDSDDDDEADPEKGDQYGYKPPRSKKLYKCEVTTVNSKAKTVTLKNLEKEGTYKSVSWDELK